MFITIGEHFSFYKFRRTQYLYKYFCFLLFVITFFVTL